MKFKDTFPSYSIVGSWDAALILGAQGFLPEHGPQIPALHLKKMMSLKALDLHQKW